MQLRFLTWLHMYDFTSTLILFGSRLFILIIRRWQLNFSVMYVHVLEFFNICSLRYFKKKIFVHVNWVKSILFTFLVNTNHFGSYLDLVTFSLAIMQTFLFMKSKPTSLPVPFYVFFGEKFLKGKKLVNFMNTFLEIFVATTKKAYFKISLKKKIMRLQF